MEAEMKARKQHELPRDLSEDERRQIADSLTEEEIISSKAWSSLDALSSQTILDEIEVLEDEITGSRDNAEGIFNLYVVLQYNDKNKEEFTSSDTYPGRFKAHFDKEGNVEFDEIEVDTSSFYA
jgi:hypothetical protein